MSDPITYEECLATYGSLTYANVGRSMLPLLRQGRDLFTLVPKVGRCSVGDVVLYRRPPNHWVLHRVVVVRADGYLTMGDNCVTRERVAEDDVIAVMTGFVRNGREHSVDEPAYRAYTRVMVLGERPRVFLKRAYMRVRRFVKKIVKRRTS